MNVLVVNAGSSSIKIALIDPVTGERSCTGIAQALDTDGASISLKQGDVDWCSESPSIGFTDAVHALLEKLNEWKLLESVTHVGHRVVHGGEKFEEATVIDDRVLNEIGALTALAPLHNPRNAQAIREVRFALPHLPHVAVFDTAFHQTLSQAAFLYGIPFELYESKSIRRYGFHGTSHQYVTEETRRRFEEHRLGIVSAHLGAGCSLAAVHNGRSVDTTMGVTPLAGLVMATRSGDIDPGALPVIAAETGRDLGGVIDLLNRESGLLGLSELTADMRELERARLDGHAGAARAFDVFVHSIAKGIGAMATSLPRFDLLAFTGGIGENSASVRDAVLRRLAVFGFEIDALANQRHGVERDGIITCSTRPRAVVIPTDEERMIAKASVETAGLR